MSALTGTGGLVRLALRRDRIRLPLWVLPIGLLPGAFAASLAQLYPTAAARESFAALAGSNPSFTALYGHMYAPNIGGITTWRAGFLPVVIGVASALTVIRHTRAEEDAGRRELLGSSVVGRHAGLAAALIVTFVASLVLGALATFGMLGRGLPVSGSIALGLGFAGAGWLFAAVAAVAAQLTEGAGAARGIAVGAVGVAYLLRMAGDAGGMDWLSWLSPLGWLQRVRPYGDERWWPLLLAVGVAVALLAVAVALEARRDINAGLLPSRPGPGTAGSGLGSAFGLAWRLHRGPLFGWLVALTATGVLFGSLGEGIGALVDDSPELADIFARIGGRAGLVDAYFGAVMSITGLIVAGYAIQAALRLRTEESAGRAEPVLATSVGRLRWLASHLVFATLGPALVLATVGLTAGLVYGAAIGDVGGQVPRVLGAALVQVPAVWVLAGLAVALFGLLPRSTAAMWAALGVCVLLGQVGVVLKLRQWLLDLSPFAHVPAVPASDPALASLAVLLAIAVGLAGVGAAGFARRDIG